METVPLRTYSNSRRASLPAGQAAQGICGTWPGSRSSHQCRSPRCSLGGAGTPRTPQRPAPRTARHRGGSAIPGPVRRQVQAGQDPPHLAGGDPGAASSRAMEACVHAVVPSAGAAVAVATIASRTSGPYTSGRPLRGRSARAGIPPRANRRRQVRIVPAEQPAPRRSADPPSLVREQHDPGAPYQRLRRGRPPRDRLQSRLAARSQNHDVLAGGMRHDSPPGDQKRSPDNARIKTGAGGGAPHAAAMTSCPCHPGA